MPSERVISLGKRARDSWTGVLLLLGLTLSFVVSILSGLPSGLIVVGSILLLIAVWNLWTSLQILSGDRSIAIEAEAADLGAPSTEEEQKLFLLRALEDIEYEKSVGKIDEEDYEELRDRYRIQAKKALKSSDWDLQPWRDQAELELKRHLEGTLKGTDAPLRSNPARSKKEKAVEEMDNPVHICIPCTTVNDADARFCKRCGKKLGLREEEKSGGSS